MSEELTAVGKYEGIKEKSSGWFEVEVDIGKQWPLRLATKRSSLLEAVRATKGETATFTYKESESERINENSGKPYINRYLEGVEPGGSTSSNSGRTAVGNGSKENVDWDAKERRDFRSRAWAQTLSTFEHTISREEDVALVFARLKPFQQMVYEDVVQELAEVKSQPDPPAANDEPPHTDDDIPFLWIDNYELEPVTVRDHHGRTSTL